MAGPNDLHEIASEFLAGCETAIQTSPGGKITRSYVAPGLPSLDCAPELSVYVGGAVEGITRPLAPPLQLGRREDQTGRVNLVPLTCVVSRCVPTVDAGGHFPSPTEIEEAAKLTNGDLWAIWNVVPALYRAKLLFARPDNESRLLFFDPAVPLATSGGVGGFQVPVRVELSGYEPEVTP